MGSRLATMQGLVSLLKAHGVIKDSRVEAAFLKTDRAKYCPSPSPYNDCPHSIGFGATISAPHMHAHALESLKDKLIEGAKVLDVGSGSGYLTVCMSHMVGPTGVVYGLEHIPDLVDQSIANIRRDCPELLSSNRVQIYKADGRAGLEQYAPYDAIHVGATAPDLPEKLIEQLKEGGRMVVPVQRGQSQMFESIDKLPGGKCEIRSLLQVVYVPLTDVISQLSRS